MRLEKMLYGLSSCLTGCFGIRNALDRENLKEETCWSFFLFGTLSLLICNCQTIFLRLTRGQEGRLSNSDLTVAYVSRALWWVQHYEDFESFSQVLNYLHGTPALPSSAASSCSSFPPAPNPSPKKAISLSKEELINQINQSVLLRNYKAQVQHQLFR